MPDLPEPWMRGPIPGVSPLTAPILYAFQQAREDLARFTDGLSTEQIWARPHGFGHELGLRPEDAEDRDLVDAGDIGDASRGRAAESRLGVHARGGAEDLVSADHGEIQ